MKVKNVIIGKQFEDSENLQEFLKIVNKKKINVRLVEAGNKINIDKKLYFEVLWPDSSKSILKNSINNNAMVCKLNYKNFSMLFTGDIEEEAENIITSQYKETKNLNSIILKVAHHGSKTSSTEKFLKLVKPKLAIIGVGENNKFGHPNDEVIQKLEELRSYNI